MSKHYQGKVIHLYLSLAWYRCSLMNTFGDMKKAIGVYLPVTPPPQFHTLKIPSSWNQYTFIWTPSLQWYIARLQTLGRGNMHHPLCNGNLNNFGSFFSGDMAKEILLPSLNL